MSKFNLNKFLNVYNATPMYGGYRVVACVYIGKTPIYATNLHKSHPLQKKYGKNSNAIFLHAEINLLRKLKHANVVPRCVYILRGTNRQWLPSLPCEKCKIALTHFGIVKWIDVYSVKNLLKDNW